MNKINLKYIDLVQDHQFQQKKQIMFIQNQYKSRQPYTLTKKIKRQKSNQNIKEIQLIKSFDVRLPLKNYLERTKDKVLQRETPKKRPHEVNQRSIKFKTQLSAQQKDSPNQIVQLYYLKQLKILNDIKHSTSKFQTLINLSQHSDSPVKKGHTQKLSQIFRQKSLVVALKKSKSSQKNLPYLGKLRIQNTKMEQNSIFLTPLHKSLHHPITKKLKILKSKRQQTLKIPIKELRMELINKKL